MDLETVIKQTSNYEYFKLINTDFDPRLIDTDSLLQHLHRENQRISDELALAQGTNPTKYASLITNLQTEIDENSKKIKELSQAPDTGDPNRKPPRQNVGGGIDDFLKEKDTLKKHFSDSVLRSILKTEQDWLYASIAIRTLTQMRVKVEDYEAGLPRAYKLEVLRRSGEYEHIIRDNGLARYVSPKGTSLFRYITKEDFAEARSVHPPGRYRQKGMTSWRDIFEKGVPCIDILNVDYKSHIANRKGWDYKTDINHRGTDSAFISATTDLGRIRLLMEQGQNTIDESYVIEFKPRGLNIIDAHLSNATGSLSGISEAMENEKSVVGIIDRRDIVRISIYQKGKLIKTLDNLHYVRE